MHLNDLLLNSGNKLLTGYAQGAVSEVSLASAPSVLILVSCYDVATMIARCIGCKCIVQYLHFDPWKSMFGGHVAKSKHLMKYVVQ